MNHVKKPDWLKISIGANARYAETKHIVDSHKLHTICYVGGFFCVEGKGAAGLCVTEFARTGTDISAYHKCGCSFSPAFTHIGTTTTAAESIQLMKLSHAVITSVDRDDLDDLGASHWAKTILEIKRLNPETTSEVLIPDFQGKSELIQQVIDAKPDIISHNMETVRRISPLVRSAADYDTSLKVIKQIADNGITAKSGIMVGLGETQEEVEQVMDDLLAHGCKIMTIGQYLQPTHKHYPVAEYITPEQFRIYREIGLKKGFKEVESAPLVRSSYHAEKHIKFKG